MATLGELVVSLSANTAQFTSAMDKAAYQSQKRMGDMMKAANQLGSAIGASMAAGAVAMSVAIKAAIDRADELGKSAQQLGVSTEALAALQYAADLSGVSAEGLSASINKLNKSIAEGNPAFEAMGVSVKGANGDLKTADVVLAEVAEKFAGYKDGAEKSALAMEIFGKAGAAMIPLLNGGAEGLAAAKSEAESFGMVLSTDVTRAAESFNDNLTRIKKTQEGLVTQLAAQMLPTLEIASEEFLGLAKNTDLVTGSAQALKVLFETLAVVGSNVAFVFKMTGQEIGGIAAQIAAFGSGDFKGSLAIGDMMKEDAARARAELDAFQNRIMNIGQVAAVEAQKAEQGGGIAAPIVKSADRAVKAAKVIDKAAQDALKAQQALITEGQRVYDATRSPAEKLAAEYERLNKLLDAGAISWDTYARAVMNAQDSMMPLAEEAKKAEEEVRALEQTASSMDIVITNAFQSAGDAVADFATGGKVSFGDMINAMIKDLIRLETQMALTSAWKAVGGASGIAGFLGTAFGATYNTNPFSEQSLMLAAQDSAFAGMRASGGPVSAGSTYLVGERGPELLSMGGMGGHITPNHALAPKVSINIENHGAAEGYQATATAQQNGSGIDIAVLVSKVVQDDQRRNGPMTQGFASAFGVSRRG
jgi:hypothetical protein